MNIHESLQSRPDILDEDVDDIVALAAELQDEEETLDAGASASDIARVAAELDIDSRFVEAAIEQWRATKEADAKQAALDTRARSRTIKMFASTVALVMVVVISSALILGTVGSSNLKAADIAVETAQTHLEVVLDRQIALAPQLVIAGGGSTEQVAHIAETLSRETDIDARLHGSTELGVEMSRSLAEAPADATDATAQMRLNLQYELTGTRNRISTETKRLREAQDIHERTANSLTGRIAVQLGMD